MSNQTEVPGQLVMYIYRLRDGAGPEYERRHREVWPGLLSNLGEEGVYDYEIWQRDELVVCRMRTRRGFGTTIQAIRNNEVQERWSKSLTDLFDQIADSAGEPLWLHQVFAFGNEEESYDKE